MINTTHTFFLLTTVFLRSTIRWNTDTVTNKSDKILVFPNNGAGWGARRGKK